MKKESEGSTSSDRDGAEEETEAVELVLFHVSECYVYLIPPRKSAASYRADEWNVNKWAWEGSLKVISKGEECIIRLEDKNTGELYAQSFLRKGEPHPVEPVIDSSRYFVLRVEENFGGRVRHAFLGIGFRERPQAYDFQAALHDHMKYLNKKKTAEEMEQHYQSASSVDYSLKEGETLVLQLKTKEGRSVRSAFFERGLNNLSLEDKPTGEAPISLKPPPPPPAPLTPSNAQRTMVHEQLQVHTSNGVTMQYKEKDESKECLDLEHERVNDILEDDFGDFQTAD
ncbi:hypothetical protein AMTRI_Chr01g110770 [Amborella trichopoda]|uniref:NECAP PHear domain-containing protein n=1 Tax=Amborella trichopoda TaxID=13333 RepID=W1Q0Z1_AMBTC|nr:uncharacterized protein At1g03900 [Amborella trichopoda]ERN13915.1 hypothetical protein AMTR_s00021p00106490 [Amborella trichopoda]|eukprot:XP_006852448.1 uncharacterized protein At1g03900 [Amborella trichopoda]